MANRVATVHVLSLWLLPFISSLSTKTWKSIFDHSSRTWIQIALNMLENFLNTSSWLSLRKWTTRCKSEHEISSSLSFPHGFMEETSDSLSTPPTLHCRALGAQVLGCSAFSGASLSHQNMFLVGTEGSGCCSSYQGGFGLCWQTVLSFLSPAEVGNEN